MLQTIRIITYITSPHTYRSIHKGWDWKDDLKLFNYDDFKGNSVFYLEYNLFMAYQTIKKERNKLQGIILKGNSHPLGETLSMCLGETLYMCLGETLYMCLGVCLYQRPNPWSPMYGFWTDRIKIFAPKKYSLLKIWLIFYLFNNFECF